jgi:hypothetical protein
VLDDSNRPSVSGLDAAPGSRDDLLATNFLSETLAAFAGAGASGRGAPDADVATEVDEIAGTLPVAAFLDEESGAQEAAEFFSFGSFGGGGGR